MRMSVTGVSVPRRVRVLVAALLAAATMAVAVPSANAASGYVLQSVATYQCLWDYPAYDYPILGECNLTNPYAQWDRWQGGWVQNRGTGRCVHVFPIGSVWMRPCQALTLQYFNMWDLGWFQSIGTTSCLEPREALGRRIEARPCQDYYWQFWNLV
jgi:hypothetical protein